MISELCAQANILGGCFFFDQAGCCSTYTTFSKSLLVQLAGFSPACAELIMNERSFDTQDWDWDPEDLTPDINSILIRLLMLLEDSLPVVLVFDGIDFFKGKKKLYQILGGSMPYLPKNLHFLITSRDGLLPGPFQRIPNHLLTRLKLAPHTDNDNSRVLELETFVAKILLSKHPEKNISLSIYGRIWEIAEGIVIASMGDREEALRRLRLKTVST